MAKTAACKPQKLRHENRVPPETQTVREILTQEVLDKTAKKSEAQLTFETILRNFPKGPEGSKLIESASTELSVARKEMTQAYSRLAAYLDSGIEPEDLKETIKKASAAA